MKLVLSCFSLVACTSELQPLDLGALVDRHLTVAGTHEAILVSLEYEGGPGGCVQLPAEFHATVNDLALDVVRDDFIDTDTSCLHSPIHFEPVTPPNGTAELVIGDRSLTMTAYLTDNFVRRTVTPDPHTAWTLPIGQDITLGWTPVADLARYVPLILLEQDASKYALASSVDGEHLGFAIPADGVFHPGTAMLQMFMTSDDETLPCDNARCTLAVSRHVFEQVVIAAP